MKERSQGEPPMCACVEMRPGVTTRSAAFTGSSTAPSNRGPTWRMRSLSSTTTPSRRRRWPCPSKAMTQPARHGSASRCAHDVPPLAALNESGVACQSPTAGALADRRRMRYSVGDEHPRARTKRRIAMPRSIKVAAAQLGPNNEGTPREEIVERMLGLLEQAVQEGVELIAYPEMALTTYFPKKIRPDFDQFFETEVPPKALEPLLRRAAEARIAVHVGFCEKAEGKYFNSALLTDRDGRLCGTFRKIHLPGTKVPDGFAQVFEPYYFAHGDTGYKVFAAAGARVGVAICQDRRYPESYRCLALQGAEIILIGYNTPASPLALDLNELCLRSGAYANLCFVVGVAKAGVEDGVELIAGSSIVNPLGQVLARAATSGDELVVARIDLDQMIPLRKRWNFLGRRQPQHYGRLLEPVTEREPHR